MVGQKSPQLVQSIVASNITNASLIYLLAHINANLSYSVQAYNKNKLKILQIRKHK